MKAYAVKHDRTGELKYFASWQQAEEFVLQDTLEENYDWHRYSEGDIKDGN